MTAALPRARRSSESDRARRDPRVRDGVVTSRERGGALAPGRYAGVPEACLNRLCIVKLAEDGPILVKEVRRGCRANRFVLTSWNALPIEDVRLDWAAAVLLIRP